MELEDCYDKLLSLSYAALEKKYEYLGEGSGRIVFGINDKYVIKVAKNNNGQVQNKIENIIYNEIEDKYKKYLCPVYLSRNHRLIMKRAIPLLSIVKNESLDIDQVFRFNSEVAKNYSSKEKEINFYRDIHVLSKARDLLYADLMAVSSWGLLKVNRPNLVNRPVLIDYGCTNRLYDRCFLI
ncbi:MAG TPA: hypothetical protein VIK72_19140 [Clostridiaceae bacterium]